MVTSILTWAFIIVYPIKFAKSDNATSNNNLNNAFTMLISLLLVLVLTEYVEKIHLYQ